MNKFIGFAAACALLCAASSASAITYVANRAFVSDRGFPGFLNLAITTDNTLGVLSTANIVDWSVQATFIGGFNLLLEGPGGANNSSWYVQGTHLTATTTDLYFDFSIPRAGPSSAFVVGPNSSNYCLQATQACQSTSGPGEIFTFGPGSYVFQPVSGNQIIASAVGGAVPEPGAWALMLAGFGLAGSALRARRRMLAA